MGEAGLGHLSGGNAAILAARDLSLKELKLDPGRFRYWGPCRIRVLIVADGLDFSPANGFGLSTFVDALLDMPWYVKMEITLGHFDAVAVGGPEMLASETRIANRIGSFKFDNATHFVPAMYDVVFLFGIDTVFARGAGYPADALSNAELQALAQFQNGGGGLFATGDHAALGKAMCAKVARVRNMRYWDSIFDQVGQDRVSMGGAYRNDTNQRGHDTTSEFNDQSDDVPQPISPVMYSRTSGIFRYSFPHPLLCGPGGVIRVMPDHPHEGECRLPPDPDLALNYTGPIGPEFPPATDGGPRPLPEIVSYNAVLAGTTSSGKAPTVAQSFPGICAYDGHRAGIGRAVTDATWHHFVNINLIGDTTAPLGDPKRSGLLATPQGQVHFEAIKAYYRNLAIWLAPPARIACINARLLWHVVWQERVLEAVLTARTIGIERIGASTLALIGRHARDILGRYAGQCQSRRIIIDLLHPQFAARIDPWRPRGDKEALDDDDLPLIDMEPALDAALGGALVAINARFEKPSERLLARLESDEVLKVAREGAAQGSAKATASLRQTMEKAIRFQTG